MPVSIKPARNRKMRVAGRLTGEVLDYITPFVKAGVTTNDLDKRGATTTSSMFNMAFPPRLITHHKVTHPIQNRFAPPSITRFAMVYRAIKAEIRRHHQSGCYCHQGRLPRDSSRMYYVGEPSIQARRLCEATWQALWRGIRAVKPGAHLGDIGHAIQSFVEPLGYSVVREFCGHGIGKRFHEEPQVLHYGRPKTGIKLEAGMIFTIEPMINCGQAAIKQLGDG